MSEQPRKLHFDRFTGRRVKASENVYADLRYVQAKLRSVTDTTVPLGVPESGALADIVQGVQMVLRPETRETEE